jgi:hypothetical protein
MFTNASSLAEWVAEKTGRETMLGVDCRSRGRVIVQLGLGEVRTPRCTCVREEDALRVDNNTHAAVPRGDHEAKKCSKVV